MQKFQGILQPIGGQDAPLRVTLQIDEGRIRLWSDRQRIGSWDARDVHIRRESIFRFVLTIEEEALAFNPDDPSGFADTVDLEIDLTAGDRPRFGLADRLRQVADAG